MSAPLRVAVVMTAVYAAGGIGMVYLPLWLGQCGLTAAAISQIYGLSSLLRLGATPAWGEVADRLGRVRPVLILAASATAAFSLGFLPAWGFLAVLAVLTLQSFCSAALQPLCDTLLLGLAHEGRLDYGRVRAVGSAAFLVTAVAGGPVVAAFGSASAPVLMALIYAAAAVLGPLLPDARPRARPPSTLGSFRLLANPTFRITVLMSALIQSSNGAYYSLSSLHWRAAGLGETTIGLLWAEGVVAETVMFLLAGPLVARLGPGWLAGLGGAGAVLRWLVTAATTDPLLLASVQWLHCASYGLAWLAALTMLTRHMPPERAATAQMLHAALGSTAATGLAEWAAGLIYDGSGSAFLLMAGLAAAGTAVAPALARADRRA